MINSHSDLAQQEDADGRENVMDCNGDSKCELDSAREFADNSGENDADSEGSDSEHCEEERKELPGGKVGRKPAT